MLDGMQSMLSGNTIHQHSRDLFCSLSLLNSTPSLDNGGHSQEDRLWCHSQTCKTQKTSQPEAIGKLLHVVVHCIDIAAHNNC